MSRGGPRSVLHLLVSSMICSLQESNHSNHGVGSQPSTVDRVPSPQVDSHICKIKRRCSFVLNFAQSVPENSTILLELSSGEVVLLV